MKLMIPRTLLPTIRLVATEYPVVSLTGPRQSGKTTLVRAAFPRHSYVSLEEPDSRAFALEDPRGFLGRYREPVILDEVQRAPELFSYIQPIVDEDDQPGRYILSGSKSFLQMRSISQSLAGRSAILHLLPLSLAELTGHQTVPAERVGLDLPSDTTALGLDLMQTLFRGFYPRIHDKALQPRRWLRSYYQTYVERDVRELLNVGDLEAFGRFMRLCAGRSGQLLNLTSLGNDCSISHTTARRWLSILEASFLIHLLRPHHRSFGKRLIKSPKLYFLDTGLLCYLLRLRSADDLRDHPLRGSIFETLIVSELVKSSLHRGEEPDLYFWRDATGHEVDLLIDRGTTLVPLEIKSGETVSASFLKGLGYWRELAGDPEHPAALVYGGDQAFRRSGVTVYRWWDL
jgi:predicted AAA+ superfamily ATPase